MRYMLQISATRYECFDSEEYKAILERLGLFVIDLENWAV